MRWVMIGAGMLLVLAGGVWIFQGIGVLKGSFMTGQAFWGWMGALCVMVGLPVLVGGVRGVRSGR